MHMHLYVYAAVCKIFFFYSQRSDGIRGHGWRSGYEQKKLTNIGCVAVLDFKLRIHDILTSNISYYTLVMI